MNRAPPISQATMDMHPQPAYGNLPMNPKQHPTHHLPNTAQMVEI